jgi:hypothetical protein
MSVFNPVADIRSFGEYPSVRLVRTIARVSHTAALIGGFAGFAAQWLIFEKGNFSETSGEVFIPMLGQHGIYTTRLLGTAWYVGLTAFSVGLLVWVVTAIIEGRTGH